MYEIPRYWQLVPVTQPQKATLYLCHKTKGLFTEVDNEINTELSSSQKLRWLRWFPGTWLHQRCSAPENNFAVCTSSLCFVTGRFQDCTIIGENCSKLRMIFIISGLIISAKVQKVHLHLSTILKAQKFFHCKHVYIYFSDQFLATSRRARMNNKRILPYPKC